MNNTAAIILAAGKGTRMRSKTPKVLHKVAGKPLVWHVINAAQGAGVKEVVVVVGHGAEGVKNTLGEGIKFALQSEQLGTGHAVMQAKDVLSPEIENVLVLCGDTPLLEAVTLEKLIQTHLAKKAACTILSAQVTNPTGYGRIIRGDGGKVLKIVEEKDADESQKAIKEINSGTYCFTKNELFKALAKITPDNAQGEYYLTDVISVLSDVNLGVFSCIADNPKEIQGVNDRVHLAAAEKVLRMRKNIALMQNGVTLIDPDTTYIDYDVEIGPDTTIYPFTLLQGDVTIGADCEIGPSTTLKNTSVGENTTITRSVVIDSNIGSGCSVGPFAYLRPGTVLRQDVKIGDFVEVKKSDIDDGSKVPHLSYIGDSTIGKNVNVGAGTITCNYDGKNKWPTVIEDGAFIGSNTNLVAPVKVGKNSVIGAGSTITKDIPQNSLAIARQKQKNILDWKKKNKKECRDL